MSAAANLLPKNPQRGDNITVVKKCPYPCKRGTYTTIAQWNGRFWDYRDYVRHCKECGFFGDTIEVRPVQRLDYPGRDQWPAAVGQLLDNARDAAHHDGRVQYIKCIAALASHP